MQEEGKLWLKMVFANAWLSYLSYLLVFSFFDWGYFSFLLLPPPSCPMYHSFALKSCLDYSIHLLKIICTDSLWLAIMVMTAVKWFGHVTNPIFLEVVWYSLSSLSIIKFAFVHICQKLEVASGFWQNFCKCSHVVMGCCKQPKMLLCCWAPKVLRDQVSHSCDRVGVKHVKSTLAHPMMSRKTAVEIGWSHHLPGKANGFGFQNWH